MSFWFCFCIPSLSNHSRKSSLDMINTIGDETRDRFEDDLSSPAGMTHAVTWPTSVPEAIIYRDDSVLFANHSHDL